MTGLVAAVVAAIGASAVSAVSAVSTPGPAEIAYPPFGLAEASGLAVSAHRPDVVWVVEDSGDPITRAFDRDGAESGSITLDGWNNRDTEALASGPDGTLWIADIGDNRAVRDSVVVHVVVEPEGDDDVVVSPTSYRFTYPDGPRDAETFLVDPVDGRAYVVSKALDHPMIYALPDELEPGGTHETVPVGDAPYLVTDGAFTPDGERMVLRDYAAAHVYEVERDDDGAITGLTAPASLAVPAQTQGESVAVTADGASILLGSEGPDEPIHAVPLPSTDPDPTSPPTDADPTATSTSPSTAVEVADDVVRRLDGEVRTTLLSMAGVVLVGSAAWLIWIRVRRSRRGRHRTPR